MIVSMAAMNDWSTSRLKEYAPEHGEYADSDERVVDEGYDATHRPLPLFLNLHAI